MSNAVTELLIEKMENAETRMEEHHKIMQEMSATMVRITKQQETSQQLSGVVEQLNTQMQGIDLPVKQIAELSALLRNHKEQMSDPPKQKIVHIHTTHKLAWAVGILFFIVIMLLMFLAKQSNKLEQNTMHDFTWRFIKLKTHKQGLKYLQQVEELYVANPEKLQQEVEQEELRLHQQFELKRLAEEKEKEAQELRKAAKKKK